MRMNRILTCWIASLAAFALTFHARGETITLATYNVEHFHDHFLAHHAATQPAFKGNNDPEVKEVLESLRRANDEDNWEVSQVILDPAFSPDVLVIEEGCEQEDLDFFNKR